MGWMLTLMWNSGLLHTVAWKYGGSVVFLPYAIEGLERPFLESWGSAVVFLGRWMPGSSMTPVANGCCNWNTPGGSNQKTSVAQKNGSLDFSNLKGPFLKMCSRAPTVQSWYKEGRGRCSRMLEQIPHILPAPHHRLQFDFNKMALLLACFPTHFCP